MKIQKNIKILNEIYSIFSYFLVYDLVLVYLEVTDLWKMKNDITDI